MSREVDEVGGILRDQTDAERAAREAQLRGAPSTPIEVERQRRAERARGGGRAVGARSQENTGSGR